MAQIATAWRKLKETWKIPTHGSVGDYMDNLLDQELVVKQVSQIYICSSVFVYIFSSSIGSILEKIKNVYPFLCA
jgi:hypothetical protein